MAIPTTALLIDDFLPSSRRMATTAAGPWLRRAWKTIAGRMRHFYHTLDAGLDVAVAKVEGFAQADGEEFECDRRRRRCTGGRSRFRLRFAALMAWTSERGSGAEEPFVRAAVFDGRVEREMLSGQCNRAAKAQTALPFSKCNGGNGAWKTRPKFRENGLKSDEFWPPIKYK